MTTTRIEIAPKTILYTIGILLSIYVLYQIRSILVLFFISFILMTAINPLLRKTQKLKIPTIVVMLIVYFGLISLVSIVIASLVPAIVAQTKGLSQALPNYLHSLEDVFATEFDPSVIGNYLSTIPSNILRLAAGLFNNLLNIMAIFFMTYYLVLERPNLHKYLLRFFEDKNAEGLAEQMVHQVEQQVGGWVRGELLLMAVIGLMTYVGLILLGIPYALPLAVLAGLLEAVPNLGPTIAAIPAVLIGFTVSPVIGLGALALCILIQQLENNLIVPKIMYSATGTAPLVTIFVLLIGFTLGGVAGAVLGMPLYLTLVTVYNSINYKS